MPPRRDLTAAPGGAAALRYATALATEPCSMALSTRPGATLSISTSLGSAEWTPATTGATRRSKAMGPKRSATSSPTVMGSPAARRFAHTSMGACRSSAARAAPSAPSATTTSWAVGSPGMPHIPTLGAGIAPTSGKYNQDPAGFGATMSFTSPRSSSSSSSTVERAA